MRIGLLLALWLCAPAQAYIDPGVGSSLFQAAYALVFGTVMAWVLRPWALLRAWWGRWRGQGDKMPPDATPDKPAHG